MNKGYITQTTRPLNVLRYAICPVIKDPRDGGIARDQFLLTRVILTARRWRELLENFVRLQTTGREAN